MQDRNHDEAGGTQGGMVSGVPNDAQLARLRTFPNREQAEAWENLQRSSVRSGDNMELDFPGARWWGSGSTTTLGSLGRTR